MASDTWDLSITIVRGDAHVTADGAQLYSGVQSLANVGGLSVTQRNLSSSIGNAWYFECIGVNPYPPSDELLGVGLATDLTADHQVKLYGDGQVWIDGVHAHDIAIPSTGLNGVIGVAARFNQIWFRIGGGPWNGNPNADPSANVGGFSIDAVALYHIVGEADAGANPVLGACTLTLNTAQPFKQPIPAGFAPWGSIMGHGIGTGSPNPPRMDTLTCIGSPAAPGDVAVKIPPGVFLGWQPYHERSPC
jgi:hypothetical protein